MTLAVADEDGPWAAPLVFINPENFDLCWVSLPTARHSLAVSRTPRAACCVVASDSTTAERALQMSVQIEKVDGANLAWEQMLQSKRGLMIPQKPGEILEQGLQWYRARPYGVYLTHLERYGFERQRVV